jgi:(E)-4-hydroxy-3-methylbut-2-enyl-diphosphate synthase
MADADYGYVGAGPGRVSLYKGGEAKLRNIPEKEALEAFIKLVKSEGDWIDP